MQVLHHLDPDAVARLRDEEPFFWLDLVDPSEADLDQLRDLFGFHELALEDSREFGQRPKLDDYDDHVLLVFYGVDAAELVEIHLYVTGSVMVTVRRGHCGALTTAAERIARHDARSEEEAVYRVLDALTDSFFPELSRLDEAIDGLQEELIEDVRPSHREQLFALRRRLVELRRVVGPQRDLLAQGGTIISGLPGFDEDEARDWFRDVYDHLLRLSDGIDALRELLAGTQEVFLTSQSNALNAATKQLTAVATIFLPLTFVTGFFGQNFGWLVDHIDTPLAFLVYGVGGMLVSGAALAWWFRRTGLLGP